MKLDVTQAGYREAVQELEQETLQAYDTLVEGTGAGNDYIDWIAQPVNYDKEEFARIHKAADKIRSDSDILVVIGIGGSYLGARAVIEAFKPSYGTPELEIVYAGNHLSAPETQAALDYVKGKRFSINVISKSGTTTEPAIAFRLFKELLESEVSEEEARGRIYVTTDKERGALKTLSDDMGYETFVVPDAIGGRYSVLTAVGLLPIAAAGIDIDQLMMGAADAMRKYNVRDFENNDALQYAALRNAMYRDGKAMEILVTYEPKLSFFAEWWKQLYGESEGKDGRALFPVSAAFTTDLHSLGQIIQQGQRNIFETVINVDQPSVDIVLKEQDNDLDGLNYLAGKTLDYVNKQAMRGTLQAHIDGDVPNIAVTIDELNEFGMGELIYFFEFACGVSGYILGINPFDQPGVEMYKKNMFQLLEKPGY